MKKTYVLIQHKGSCSKVIYAGDSYFTARWKASGARLTQDCQIDGDVNKITIETWQGHDRTEEEIFYKS